MNEKIGRFAVLCAICEPFLRDLRDLTSWGLTVSSKAFNAESAENRRGGHGETHQN